MDRVKLSIDGTRYLSCFLLFSFASIPHGCPLPLILVTYGYNFAYFCRFCKYNLQISFVPVSSVESSKVTFFVIFRGSSIAAKSERTMTRLQTVISQSNLCARPPHVFGTCFIQSDGLRALRNNKFTSFV